MRTDRIDEILEMHPGESFIELVEDPTEAKNKGYIEIPCEPMDDMEDYFCIFGMEGRLVNAVKFGFTYKASDGEAKLAFDAMGATEPRIILKSVYTHNPENDDMDLNWVDISTGEVFKPETQITAFTFAK
jgi:hypothetical protein